MNSRQRRKYSRYVDKNIFPILERGFKDQLRGNYIYSTYYHSPEIRICYYADRANINIPAFHIVNTKAWEGYAGRRKKIFKNERWFYYIVSDKLNQLKNLKSFKQMRIKEYTFSSKAFDYGTDIPHFKLETKSNYYYIIGESPFTMGDDLEIRKMYLGSERNGTLCKVENLLEDPNVDPEFKKEILFNIDLW